MTRCKVKGIPKHNAWYGEGKPKKKVIKFTKESYVRTQSLTVNVFHIGIP